MFDMGFAELLVIAVIGLLVIGPKRMPEAIRVLGYWLGKLRRSVHGARQEMEREFGLDDIRRDLHNEALLSQLDNERKQIEQSLQSIEPSTTDSTSPDSEPGTLAPRSTTPMADKPPLSQEEEQEMLKAFDDFDNEFGTDKHPESPESPESVENSENTKSREDTAIEDINTAADQQDSKNQ